MELTTTTMREKGPLIRRGRWESISRSFKGKKKSHLLQREKKGDGDATESSFSQEKTVITRKRAAGLDQR